MSDELDPTTLVEPAATRVRDPISNSSVWLANIVRNVRMQDGNLRFDLVFQSGHSRDDRRAIEAALIANLRGLGFEGEVLPFPRLEGSAPAERSKPPLPGMDVKGVAPHGGAISKKKLAGVKHVIAVASGKGGVGKSTVSTNLAVALVREGLQVGLVDLDIYGPSLPRMMNVSQRPMVDSENKIIPVNSYGVRCLSTGLLVAEDEAMIWRGPMIMGIIRQFLQDVRWEGLDVLVVDLPPGTGDAQLTLFQAVELSGGIVVTTPQEVALADAIRGITMFRKLDVPFLGIVENMAYYELPDGSKDYVFGEGGGVRTAKRYDTEVLAQLPLRTTLRRSCDQGLPAALGDDATAQAFRALARRVAQKLGLGPN
jgi:ATP-binding protein involved in chromosome partitioning